MISNDKDNNRTKIPTKVPIKIKINKNTSSVIIFLTHNKELVGFVECKLYEDNKAELNAAGFMNNILKTQFKQDCFGTPAIRIEEKYRRQGRETILLIILFEYLINRGINSLNVHTIESDSAWNFYLKNGATKIDDMNAIFYDIKSLIPYLYKKISNQLDDKIEIFNNQTIRK